MKHKGAETRNHIARRANIVPNGTAADDFSATRKKFKITNIVKINLYFFKKNEKKKRLIRHFQ